MSYGPNAVDSILVSDIDLDVDNPRHTPLATQDEVIEYLCKGEQVYQLAEDIIQFGMNPLELFAILPRARKSRVPYVVAEGNRRLCALKLLNNPSLAPVRDREKYAALSKDWDAVEEVNCIVFDEPDEVRIWIERIHNGPQNGRGRKSWNSEQKTRYDNQSKNALALELLDYAEDKGLLKSKDRKRKLTTVQRYLSNKEMREALGLDDSKESKAKTSRPKADFDKLLGRFVDDLVEGTVNSRAKSDDVEKYAAQLNKTEGITGKTQAPRAIVAKRTAKKTSARRQGPTRPTRRHKISSNSDIRSELSRIGNFKLERLYYSITEVGLTSHTPLLAVGVWSFLETLTALSGRTSSTAFPAYLNPTKLETLGVGKKLHTKAARDALQRCSDFGNTTKHHSTSAAFNGEQLANDFETIEPVILAIAKTL